MSVNNTKEKQNTKKSCSMYDEISHTTVKIKSGLQRATVDESQGHAIK